ncbi:hypothetical protein B0J12DRAFT_777595 [Macrophomina phaseolina]|uniref:N-acetyltransferase domain-containing protein n=1 Tax=Macrophomina phaseolina TaxID=35725 RepID=A0ABQ8GEY3_9PEZI|nr:hypothetical protein B0J12DRAFT_777595 [Macrophomina phaseolina]
MTDHTISDNLFHCRLATAGDIAPLHDLLKPMFASGALGEDLVFGDLELHDALDWMLPRFIVDPQTLLIVVEFKPPGGMRSYPPQIAGVAYVRIPRPRQVSQLNSEGLSSLGNSCAKKWILTALLGLSLLWLRASNKIQDIGLWPTFQTSAVYRRIMSQQERLDTVRVRGQGTQQGCLYFLAVAPKFRGVGIGSRLLAHIEDVLRNMGMREVSFIGGTESARFIQQHGFSASKSARSGDFGDFVKCL